MTKTFMIATGLLLALAPVSAQDATKDAPDAYRLQFENSWVRVVRVHYGPNATVPVHAHSRSVTTYVYLNASGPVRFKHIGGGNRVATRQPMQAGSFRVSRGGDEVHEVENTTAAPSDFLRLEFKTDPKGDQSPYFRGARGLYPAGENAADVQFTNRQMRITRLIIAPGKSIDVTTPDAQPALLVALTDATLSVARASSMEVAMAAGQERWIDTRQRERISNTGARAAEFLRVDFLTRAAD